MCVDLCGDKETENIPVIATHSYGDWVVTTKKRIGKVEGFCMIALYVAYAIYIVIR